MKTLHKMLWKQKIQLHVMVTTSIYVDNEL